MMAVLTHLLATMGGAVVAYVVIALCIMSSKEDEELNKETNSEI